MHRLINPNDADILFTIFMDEKNNPFLSYDQMSREAFQPLFDELLQQNESFIFELNHEVVATYRIKKGSYRTAHVAYIGSLGVHPQHQGKGIGTTLIHSLVEQLRAEGFKRLELYVDTDNPRGIHFYKKLGFTEEAILKNYFKRSYEESYMDEIVMVMML